MNLPITEAVWLKAGGTLVAVVLLYRLPESLKQTRLLLREWRRK